ncbi:MAG: lipoprotein-releasing ABC transporter permease subunit [Rickettsiales bacterium]|jgi:lipoprotein-releasing system permease protein|nr:lipoprotein-releasing ABC transporter permease subunit [Rickettsiales bacterium]
MFSKFEFFIAFRYLRDRRKERFISITTYFSFLGIMLGVGTLIVVMSVMNGFREELIGKIMGMNAHVSIFPKEESMQTYKAMIEILKDDADIKYISPLVESHAMFVSKHAATGGMVKAIAAEDLNHRESFCKNLGDGDKLKNFGHEGRAIVGKQLARSLGLTVGDSFKVISPEITMTVLGIIPRAKTYQVFGIFESGMYEYDSSVIFIPLTLGQLQFGHRNSVSVIEIFLERANMATEKMRDIRKKLREAGYKFDIVDWKSTNASLITALNTERNVMFLILTLIIIIAVFNVITGLVMLVMDKKKQIALLKTIGVSSGGIVRIFFICGITVGFLGTFSGAIAGSLFATNIENIRRIIEHIFNTNLFNPVIYYLSRLPSKVFISDVLWVSAMSMVFSVLATIYPSLKASRVCPVEILRNE